MMNVKLLPVMLRLSKHDERKAAEYRKARKKTSNAKTNKNKQLIYKTT